MGINQIIYFYAKNSTVCSDVTTFIEQYQIPITFFEIKSKQIANTLKNGSKFKINAVPTIIVITDTDHDQIEGSDACISFLQYILKENDKISKDRNYVSDSPTISGGESEIIEDEDSEEVFLDDDEVVNHFKRELQPPPENLLQDNGKLDVSAIAQRAEQERMEFEQMHKTQRPD